MWETHCIFVSIIHDEIYIFPDYNRLIYLNLVDSISMNYLHSFIYEIVRSNRTTTSSSGFPFSFQIEHLEMVFLWIHRIISPFSFRSKRIRIVHSVWIIITCQSAGKSTSSIRHFFLEILETFPFVTKRIFVNDRSISANLRVFHQPWLIRPIAFHSESRVSMLLTFTIQISDEVLLGVHVNLTTFL